MPNWTNEQLLAIKKEGDLLVSAGAGSGKTAVLTARIVRLIEEGESINSVLCVTFTNAAAAEMKKRIEKSLASAAQQSEGEKSSALYRASSSVNAASISTLHSFCTQVLRRHFAIAGLDPAFRVADEGEMSVLRSLAYNELVEDRYALGGKSFIALMDGLGGDEAAESAINTVYDFARSQVDPFKWLDDALEKYDASTPEELMSSRAAEEMYKKSIRSIAAACDTLQAARDELMQNGEEDLAAFIDAELFIAREPLLCQNAKELISTLDGLSFDKRRIKWGTLEGPLRDNADSARKKLKDQIKTERTFWCGTIEDHCRVIAQNRPLIEELCSFIKELDTRYAAKKSEAGCIDYGDMEHMCLDALKNDEVKGEYSRRFKHVFMDEYQDCNPVQESILKSITENAETFLVGDVKQSIYRFRLAEPELFMQRYADYKESRGGTLICLNHNFRSTQGVIAAVNSLFERIMHRTTAEIEYDEEAALKCGRGGEDTVAAEFMLLDMLQGAELDDDETDEAETDIAAAEAASAARRIHELMESETVSDSATGEERRPKYSDFAVLLRSHKASAETWMRTLAANGVPAYALLSSGYFDAIEVRVFVDLLRVIDNRRQDIPLAAVLRSPIGGFSDVDMIALKTEYPAPEGADESDWAWIDRLNAAAHDGGELGQKAARLISMIDRFRREADILSAEALIGFLLDETGFGEYCAAMSGGRQRQANLEALCEMARSLAQAGVRSLGSFLNYMDKVSAANVYGVPQTGGANVVTVMSIHSSKGLEFPYVIIGGMNSQFVREGADKLCCDKELGIGARFIFGDKRQASFIQSAIAASLNAKAAAEEMRVLYVAMTRARERLIMICAAKNGQRLIRAALVPQTEASVFTRKSFAQWVLGHILATKSGNAIRERYSLEPVLTGDAHISARALPAPSARPGGGRMNISEYRCFVENAIRHVPAKPVPWFNRVYAYSADVELPTKLSVTSLSGGNATQLEAMPAFMREEDVRGAQRGSVVHDIMRALELKPQITEQSILDTASLLVERGIMSRAEADAVPYRRIAEFFEGELGQRLVHSDTVRREAEFNLRISARELLGADTDEPILLQGVIDCCFLEHGEWVLIDYKTDFVPKGTSAYDAASKHFTQLALYKRALERLSGKRVKESYIYLFGIGCAVRMDEEG